MLLKCTAEGRTIEMNGVLPSQGNGARGMKMTTSTSPTMSTRVHRKVVRAPHKRPHPGKIAHAGKMVHSGKLSQAKVGHPGKMVHAGKMAHHLGKFGKLAHYAFTHATRPPEHCENSNDSGLGPDPINRSSETLEDWDHIESKKRRADSESGVKIECDDANDAYAFPAAQAVMPVALTALGVPPAPAPLILDAPPTDLAPTPANTTPVMRAGCSISSPSIAETPGKRFQDAYRSCGKLGGKLANKYAAGGKLTGTGGKMGGKMGGKYGGKLAQALARRRALAAMAHSGPSGLAAPLSHRTRDGSVELQILCQPESQHRARYQTEGSRGAVKDNSGNGFPIVKLVGYDKPAVLQVFIGTDTGRVAPHMFYQACRVSGKNSTPCKERKDDGTVLIEIDLEPSKNWQVTCDCVGILKERNVDVEHRFGDSMGSGGGGAAHVSRGKKKSTRCRMVFRTDVLNAAGQRETIQVCSTQIICTQPPGVPEVCRKSLVSCPATGGLELYLLGKNFLKETRVVFSHRQDGCRIWEEEVVPDKEFLQQTHLVCCVPPYARTDLSEAVAVSLWVRAGGRASEPHAFYYTPAAPAAPAPAPGAAPAPGEPPAPPPLHATPHPRHAGAEPWPLMPPPARPARRPSLLHDHDLQGLKNEVKDETSQHSFIDHSDTSCGADGPERQSSPQAILPDDLSGVDLRLKTESRDSQNQVGYVSGYEQMKLSPSTPVRNELATFTQQLQAIKSQVQTDKMVETVTAAIFNTDESAGQIYQPIMPMAAIDPLRGLGTMRGEIKALESGLMMPDGTLRSADGFNPFGAMDKMDLGATSQAIEQRLAQQSAHMDALVEDAMQATASMLPGDAAKLDALVNMRVDDLAGSAQASLQASLPDAVPLAAVKTPPAAVKSMILNAAAEILTSDSTMNALVKSAINTASILTENEPPAAPAAEAAMSQAAMSQAEAAAMSHAVSRAVTQAVSHAVSQAVSAAVTHEMSAPVHGLTDMSDQDLLSYINPSTFDQV